MSPLTTTRRRLAVIVALSLLASCVSAQLPSGTWQYHWGDDFSGETLDPSKWSYNYPWGTSHNHDAVMSSSQVAVRDGALTLTARRTGSGADFVSGAVTTGYTKATFNSGYVEASIRLPDTAGSWPAFWGLYSGWPPENDIMEYPIDTAAGSGYSQDQYHTAFHYSTGGGNAAGAGQVNPGSAGDLGGTYHTFGMEWREDDWVGYYFDGQLVQQFGNDSAIAQMEQMYLILNYAVGGWPGTPNTSEWPVGHTDEMKVDFVRVWKQASGQASDWLLSGRSPNVSWDSTRNWTNGAPNLGGVSSTFSTLALPEQNIDWSGRRTLTVINLDGSTQYRFGDGGGERLVLGYGNGGALHPAIHVAADSTAEHQVAATLEVAGGLNITNDSAQPLTLAGSMIGAGAVEINGVGVVSFDGDNSYRGDTIIDSGAQGPAIARARGANAFGLGGTVVIGSGGNSTTARMELENNSLVSNPINANGRNNSSAAIVNNSGENVISGTVNLQWGGGQYLVRSDQGLLTLSADSPSAGGVSVRAAATGARTLTLSGDGDGRIDGAIVDGAGQVSVVKAGAGVWTLSGDNSHTGETTVTAGVLIVDGRTGAGGATLSGDATLAGRGLVRGGLVAQTGTTVRVGAAGLPVETPHNTIDDFENYAPGAVRDVASPPWTTHQDTSFANIETLADNQALSFGWQNATRGASRSLASDEAIANDELTTLFFRIQSRTASPNHNLGVGDQASTGEVDFADFEAQLRLTSGDDSASFALDARNGRRFTSPLATGLALDTWHNVWMVVDQTADTYDLYLSDGEADASEINKLNNSPLNFRNGTTETLDFVLALADSSDLDNAVLVDDLNYTPGRNLSNPLSATPSTVGETLTIEGDYTQAAGAALQVDVGDGVHDTLLVTGAANLQGVLEVTLDPGYQPSRNDTFVVATAQSLTHSLTLGGPDGDRFRLVHSNANQLVLTAVGGLPGDFNDDGVVDAADYTVWRDNLGADESVLPGGSGDGSGTVDQGDYATWRANYGALGAGSLSSTEAANAPEPSSWLLLGMLGLSLAPFRRPARA